MLRSVLLALALCGCGSGEGAPQNLQVEEVGPPTTPAAEAPLDESRTAAAPEEANLPADIGTAVAPGACQVQDGRGLPANRLRAIGTEPFWGAKIEGRCVTYSHPDDQAGTRIWTRFSGSENSGLWIGAYKGKPFILHTRRQSGCSDGMSDRRYPIAVSLTVGGEEREGCAEPL